jgi:hypothetical protein
VDLRLAKHRNGEFFKARFFDSLSKSETIPPVTAALAHASIPP